MDLLAAYDSDSGSDKSDAGVAAAEYDHSAGNGTAAQQRLAESADQDHTQLSKRPRLNAVIASSKVETSEAPDAGAGAAAANMTASQPAEPERVLRFPIVEGLFPTLVYLPVHGGAAQQLHALTDALVTACAAADLTAHCDEHIQGRSGSSSGSRKLQLWPTCSASNGSSIACGTEPAEPQQQQQQQQLGQKGAEGTNSLPLHLSLSQTVPIRYGQAASLKAALEQQLRPCRKFKLQLAGLVCLTNEPKTRSFVCIRVASGSQQVLRMIRQVDAAFALHGLPEFYKEPIPHVSLAWAPADQTQVLQQWLDSVKHEPVAMQVTQAVCQVGKVKHTVWEA